MLVHFDRRPLFRHAVICIVTPLLGLNEGVRDGAKMDSRRLLRAFGRIVFESGIDLRDLRFGGRLHRAVIETAAEYRSQLRPGPVSRCLGYQEMEERVVGRGNGPPQAGLMRALRVQICKVLGEFEQVIGKPHASYQGRLIEFGLLGLAAKVEVRKHAPLFQGLNFLDDGLFDLVADVQELIAPAGGIGEDHHEENCRLSAPIVPKRGNDADHVRAEALRGSRYCRLESGWLGKRRWNVHDSIIARPGKEGVAATITALGFAPAARSSGVIDLFACQIGFRKIERAS